MYYLSPHGRALSMPAPLDLGMSSGSTRQAGPVRQARPPKGPTGMDASAQWAVDTASATVAWAKENPLVGGAIVAGVAALAAAAYYGLKPSPSNTAKEQTAPLAQESGNSRTRRLHSLELDEYERALRRDIILPYQIEEGFHSIGGLEEVIEQVEMMVTLPLTKPHLFKQSRLANRPTGVLLYGPPGTGKTLLAKAIAKECGASFINVNLATIMSKYVGDSEKMVQAIFSLAHKLSPCIVFVDEMDGFLSRRTEGSMDPAVTDKVKTLFMAMWDGIATASTRSAAVEGAGQAQGSQDVPQNWVLVIGATNRPHALDQAILRRMPRQIEVGLPSAAGRLKILRVLLKGENVAAEGSGPMQCDLQAVADATAQYSGSDLKELCRAAALRPIREASTAERMAVRAAREAVEEEYARRLAAREAWEAGQQGGHHAPASQVTDEGGQGAQPGQPLCHEDLLAWRDSRLGEVAASASAGVSTRPVVTADFAAAMREVRPTGMSAYEYQQRLAAAEEGIGDGTLPVFAPAGAAFGGGVKGNSARLLSSLPSQ